MQRVGGWLGGVGWGGIYLIIDEGEKELGNAH
jgi:hypothetical protein